MSADKPKNSHATFALVAGNSFEVLQQVADNTYDACITDPPYGIKIDEWDNEIPAVPHWQAIYRVLKPGAFCVSFAAPKLYHHLAFNIEQAGFIIQDMILWIETNKMTEFNRLRPAHEPICVAQKPYQTSIEYNMAKWGVGKIGIEEARVPWTTKIPKIWSPNPNGRYPSNVVGYLGDEYEKYFYAPQVTPLERGYYNDHKTVKPVDLMAWLVKLFCPAKGITLDPFMGTGSTGLAAIREGRRFIGIERDQHYVDIAKRRFDEAQMLQLLHPRPQQEVR